MRRLLFCLAPALLAVPQPALGQDGWRISELSGDVRISEGGRMRPAARGVLLSSGSSIAAGARSRAVLVRGRQYVVVSPGSRVTIPAAQQQQSRGVLQMITDWGTALFRVDRREAPHFEVGTPYLAAVVRGTTFTVTVGEAGATVQVTEGAVQVSTNDGGASELVRPGMIATVGASDLYQLRIDGEQSRVIRSDRAPAGAVSSSLPAPVQPAAAAGAVRIEAPIMEPAVSLSEATGGLIDRGADVTIAAVFSTAGNLSQPTPPPPVQGPPPPVATTPPPPPVVTPPPPVVTPTPPPPVVTLPPPPPAVTPPPPPPVVTPPPPPPVVTPPPPPPVVTPPPPPPVVTPPPPPPVVTPPPPPPETPPPPVVTPPPPPPVETPPPPPPPVETSPPPPPVDEDDGNNGHGNDDDGEDDSNPGHGGGRDKHDDHDHDGDGVPGRDDPDDRDRPGRDEDDRGGSGHEPAPPAPPADDNDEQGDDGDGNNGHGNDDGEDDSNPGRGGDDDEDDGDDADDD